jgi:hypothetical protein
VTTEHRICPKSKKQTSSPTADEILVGKILVTRMGQKLAKHATVRMILTLTTMMMTMIHFVMTVMNP